MDVTMPQLGETVTEGTITRWFKQVGETVAADEPLFEVSTDKVDSEVPAPTSGVVSEILVPEGDTVDVGVRLAVISDSAGAAAPAPPPAPAPAPEPAPEAPTPPPRRPLRRPRLPHLRRPSQWLPHPNPCAPRSRPRSPRKARKARTEAAVRSRRRWFAG
jgi:2-oxoglutarate dehydrogenase E2 component (dihydrolipoamide succinyltransferase)